ncbi:MAG: Wzz/FepE/Etk N-terminal domain-containing protein, partial [Patescibacteria group bacterium]
MKQKILLVFAVSIFVGLLGAGVSTILPNQYTAKGLLIVTRKADELSKEVFTYEGYYAQQNAGAYTATFLSILQSPNNLKFADSGADLKELSR